MSNYKTLKWTWSILIVVLAGVPHARAEGKKVVQEDHVVAGGPKDFLEVRHLVLQGTNEEIGQALATIASKRFKVGPTPSSDPFRTRVQRRYLEKNYPILLDRMRGVAAAYGHKIDDDAWNFAWLDTGQLRAGCSVVYYPPAMTSTGGGIVSRNYDFTTGTFRGAQPPVGELPCTARPCVVEMYPDRGYASLALYSYDLLSGVLDGVNSQGLTVALLADDELMNKYRMEPAGDSGVGLGVLQVLRFLLDTCASVEQAKEALLLTKQYYEIVPVHYLIADRHGHAFVWEYSQAHNREYFVENPGKALVTTNFSLHRYLEGTHPPSAEKVKEVCPRYCALLEKIAAQPGKLTPEIIKEAHKPVDATRAGFAGRPPHRTLWHALYFPEQRKVQISFYLRDEPTDGGGKARIVRSDYLEFALDNGERRPSGR
jgi:hypothetical protein